MPPPLCACFLPGSLVSPAALGSLAMPCPHDLGGWYCPTPSLGYPGPPMRGLIPGDRSPLLFTTDVRLPTKIQNLALTTRKFGFKK